MSTSSALFSDSVKISAGPSLHDLLKSLEDGKIVHFTVGGRELTFRVTSLQVGSSMKDMKEGDVPDEWGIGAALMIGDRQENHYRGYYNSKTREGMFERPKTIC